MYCVMCIVLLTLGAHAQRGLRYLVRVCLCLSAPFRPLRVKVSPENDTNASSRQNKEKKIGDFLKMLRSKVMASFAHFVGVRRSCRALLFILTATEAAIATQKPNGKLNTAC